MKRSFDIVLSIVILILTFPVITILALLIWLQDRHNPFYLAPRVGKNGQPFTMIKLRSMVVDADKTGVDSTAADDPRITPIGHFIRRYKLDELPQVFNVLKGDMSFVGPRPNVKRDVDLYTSEERRLLLVRPGITDLASIVFSDEGEILRGQEDPDLAYSQLIRPGKNRLGLFYVYHHTLVLDLQIIFLTLLALINKRVALKGVVHILQRHGANKDLIDIARRERPLEPMPPPGARHVINDHSTIPT